MECRTLGRTGFQVYAIELGTEYLIDRPGLKDLALEYKAPVRSAYDQLPVKADACTRCGACEKRSPFGVSTVEEIQNAAEYRYSFVRIFI